MSDLYVNEHKSHGLMLSSAESGDITLEYEYGKSNRYYH